LFELTDCFLSSQAEYMPYRTYGGSALPLSFSVLALAFGHEEAHP